MPTDEEVAKILYWVMLVSPTPKEVRQAFGKEFERDHWNNATGRTSTSDPAPDLSRLIWQHDPIQRDGESVYFASEAATWYVTDLGLEWLKRYEERQHDTE